MLVAQLTNVLVSDSGNSVNQQVLGEVYIEGNYLTRLPSNCARGVMDYSIGSDSQCCINTTGNLIDNLLHNYTLRRNHVNIACTRGTFQSFSRTSNVMDCCLVFPLTAFHIQVSTSQRTPVDVSS